MELCLVHQDGAIVLHRKMQAAPEPCLQAMHGGQATHETIDAQTMAV